MFASSVYMAKREGASSVKIFQFFLTNREEILGMKEQAKLIRETMIKNE